MALRTVREALTLALAIMEARSLDPRLTAVERAQAGENAQQCTLTINALRPNDTVTPGQRAGRSSALVDRVKATIQIDDKYALPASEFYDGLDLMADSAASIAAGEPTFESVLSDGVR